MQVADVEDLFGFAPEVEDEEVGDGLSDMLASVMDTHSAEIDCDPLPDSEGQPPTAWALSDSDDGDGVDGRLPVPVMSTVGSPPEEVASSSSSRSPSCSRDQSTSRRDQSLPHR